MRGCRGKHLDYTCSVYRPVQPLRTRRQVLRSVLSGKNLCCKKILSLPPYHYQKSRPRNFFFYLPKADRKKAEIKVKTLEIRYQYTPKEDSCPIAKWKKNWGKIVKYDNGNMELTFKDFKDTPYLSHPTEPDTNDINRRNSYRILQMNVNTRH